MASLSGKVLFITGASRGIGEAIALRAARDGAAIVVAAKTSEPHPKLPGTIHTAAQAIQEAGGQALPCVVDIRDEAQIEAAMQQAVATFGGIDILVNNASAISLTGTRATSTKRFDLMHQVNARGTFLCGKLAIPHLRKSANPHILSLAPPLNMEARWFAPHVAYTMAKYGMSMCTLAWAQELRSDGIAVNALWPKTAIDTSAVRMLMGGEKAAQRCRTREILADAAHHILTRNASEFTGRFCIDEDVLKEAGETNFDKYAVDPTQPLLPDFFL